MTVVLVFGFLFVFNGCSSFQEKIDEEFSEGRARREFQFRKLWVRDTLSNTNKGYRKINRMTPLIYKDLVIQGNSFDGVVAYRQDSGQRVWTFPVYEGVESSSALFKDFLFIPGNDGFFYSLNAATGALNWKIATQTENLGEPFYDETEGIVFFQTGLGSVYSVDAASGRIIWTYSRQDTSQFSIRGNSQPVVYKDFVFNGFSDGSLVALNKKTGTVAWEIFLNKNRRFRDIDSKPYLDGNLIYIQAFDDQLYCVSAENGTIQWKTDFGGYDGLLVTQDFIYASTTESEVIALEKQSGKVKWRYKSKGGLPSRPVAYDNTILFGESQGALVFLERDSGEKIFEFSPGRGIMSAPAILEVSPKQNLSNSKNKRNSARTPSSKKLGKFFFISGEGNLYGIEAGWGRPAPKL